MRCILLLLLALIHLPAGEARVTVTGKSASDQTGYREAALADALREAVRQGVGITVAGGSQVSGFMLDYDQVLTLSFGHVKSYRVLGSSLGADGLYRVEVEATVAPGEPGLNDRMRLRMLVQRKGSPRVGLEITDQCEGVAGPGGLGRAWFEQTCTELHLHLVDAQALAKRSQQLAERDRRLGEGGSAAERLSGLTDNLDYLIQGTVRVRHVGRESLYGGLPEHRFSIGTDLKVLRVDTGEVVAAAATPETTVASSVEQVEPAARQALHRVLAGANGGEVVLRRLLARWTVDLDLGAFCRLELPALDRADYNLLRSSLPGRPGLGAVVPRTFDGRGISVIEVESRISSGELGDLVARILEGRQQVDRDSKAAVLFRPATRPVPAAPPQASPSAPDPVRLPASGSTPSPSPGASQEPTRPSPAAAGRSVLLPLALTAVAAVVVTLGAVWGLRRFRRPPTA